MVEGELKGAHFTEHHTLDYKRGMEKDKWLRVE